MFASYVFIIVGNSLRACQSIHHQLINKINGASIANKMMQKFFHFEHKETNSSNFVRTNPVSLIFLSSDYPS